MLLGGADDVPEAKIRIIVKGGRYIAVDDGNTGAGDVHLRRLACRRLENVGRTGVAAARVFPIRPDNGAVAADRDRPAELVIGFFITGLDFGVFTPDAAGTALENVGRPGA